MKHLAGTSAPPRTNSVYPAQLSIIHFSHPACIAKLFMKGELPRIKQTAEPAFMPGMLQIFRNWIKISNFLTATGANPGY
eukprot:2474036-Amphidinium_carterae.1